MAGKLKREADIVKNQVNDYLNATTAYSKYLNGEAPCYITYYQIIPEASREDYSLEEYIQVCEEYFNWICDYLSKEDRVYRGVIYKKLDEMGL